MFTNLYNNENLRLFASSLPGALLVYKLNTDGTDELLFLSETAEELWEINFIETLKNINHLWGTVLPEDLPAMRVSIQKSAADGSLWNHTHRIKTKSGKIKWLNGKGMPVKQNDGSTVWHTLILNVTDLKLLEIELEAKSKKLESYAQKHSHDLRAPLATLLGLLNLIEEHHADNLSEAKIILSQLLKTSHRLDGIVRQMANDLDF